MTSDREPSRQEAADPIDWAEILGRIESVGKALGLDDAPSERDARATLKARARALARKTESDEAVQASIDVVEFRLASETYGVESTSVREVYLLRELAPIPGVPPFVLGIANVRGQILSVIDLKRFFDLPEGGLGRLNKIIILSDGQMEFGVLADEVLGTHAIGLRSIQEAPPTVSGIGAEYLRGVTGEGVILLDAQRLLEDENIVVQQEADQPAASHKENRQ